MPSTTITELIQMYSTGVISRESLEREIRVWDLDEEPGNHRPDAGLGDECIVLYPDPTGTWRMPA